LDELPESLDETYERVLKEIKKPNRDHARRLLQCLVVAVRPLQVNELAEVLAVDFDGNDGTPKLNASWRWEDQEQALLSSCSSLITIVEDLRVVQFSHFSVREFLTSPRLGTSSGDISRYHVDLESAHTILAQACLSVLLQLDGHAEKNVVQRSFPLAQYAAEHWASHARFQGVSTHIHQGMERLFDPDRQHFSAWLRFHDMDKALVGGSPFYMFTPSRKLKGGPLYYASLCGLHDLARFLIVKYPGRVNALGGYCVSPLVAALSREHFQTAELLHRNGADPNVQGDMRMIPLHSAAYSGNLQMVEELIKYNADTNALDTLGFTPLHCASRSTRPNTPNVIRLLLDRGVDVNPRASDGSTPLHFAVQFGFVEVVRVLLERGADVQAKDREGKTPLRIAPRRNGGKIMELLRE
jgi:hypothetical protein